MMKWKKRLLVVAAVLIVIYFALPILDHVWFTFHIPSDFSDARWRGDWNSDYFSPVSGRLLVKMPDPVPKDQEFDIDALVYYRIWSPYRTGGTVRMKMVGYLASGASGGGGNADGPVIVPPHYTFKFKASDGPSAQMIDYVATSDAHDTMIVGGYRSAGPYDMGRFALTRR
jgi:hypothetical protein